MKLWSKVITSNIIFSKFLIMGVYLKLSFYILLAFKVSLCNGSWCNTVSRDQVIGCYVRYMISWMRIMVLAYLVLKIVIFWNQISATHIRNSEKMMFIVITFDQRFRNQIDHDEWLTNILSLLAVIRTSTIITLSCVFWKKHLHVQYLTFFVLHFFEFVLMSR